MATNISMPKLGMTMEEGNVAKWFKSVGETVKGGEALVEIETDKITKELDSPVDGVVIQIAVPEGQSAAINALLAVIGEPGEKAEPVENKTNKPEAAIEPPHIVTREDGKPFASPAVKRLARETGVDISVIAGSGPNGRVVERDIIYYQKENKKISISPLAAKIAAAHGILPAELEQLNKNSRIMKADIEAIIQKATPIADGGIPLTGIRKVISERMSMNWQTSPHVSVEMEVDMTEAKALRSKLMDAADCKFSYTEIIVKACALALIEFKRVNSSLINSAIYEHESANIGLAVAIDNGLLVPVIKDSQNKSIRTLRKEIEELTRRAHEGSLEHDQITGGTFTVSNMGMYGVTRFTSIINAPESAILGAASIIDRPVAIKGEIVVRPIMNICLTFDHRVFDGAMGAQFLGRIRQLLEQPYLLF